MPAPVALTPAQASLLARHVLAAAANDRACQLILATLAAGAGVDTLALELPDDALTVTASDTTEAG